VAPDLVVRDSHSHLDRPPREFTHWYTFSWRRDNPARDAWRG